MNRANPIYFIHALPDNQVLVACWIWYRRFLAEDPPDRWEVVPREQLPAVEDKCRRNGFRLIAPLETRRQAVWQQLRKKPSEPRRSPKQQAKHEARQARKREQEAAEAEFRQMLSRQQNQFRADFSGLPEAEIRRKYRSLARHHHPDTGGSSESFRLLETAYREALRRSSP